MRRLIMVATLILSLFSFSNAFAYSTTFTGDGMGDGNMIMFNMMNISFSSNLESGGASDSRSGSFIISSDYGKIGTVETDVMFSGGGEAMAYGGNPYANFLVDFTITDHATGNVIFSLYDNAESDDSSGSGGFAFAMTNTLPPQIPQSFQLGTLYDWSLVLATSASATGEDDGMGGYFPPSLNGSGFADATILFTSVDAPAVTPIPGAVWLFGTGLVGLAGLRRKMKA